MSVQASRGRTPAGGRGASPAPFAAGAYEVHSATPPLDVAAIRAELKGDIRALRTRLANSDGSSVLAGEIASLRALIEDIAVRPTRGGARVGPVPKSLGVEGPAATALGRVLKGKNPDGAAVREALATILKVTEWPVDDKRALVAMIGPSGVGKTTTAAKLAARVRMQGRSVTLIGCDSFRVGAHEQLARYGGLMGAEVVWARTPEVLQARIQAASSDVVIVDTSGRPPTSDGVESGFPGRGGVGDRSRHVLLCMTASTRSADAARIARLYGVLRPTSLVATKLDETETPAGIVHAAWAARLPYSVLCFGQRVPEDVGPATLDALATHLAPRVTPKAVAA